MRVSKKTTLVVAAALCSSLASAIPNAEHVIHEKRDYVPDHWTKVAAASGDEPIDLRIALKQNNLHRAQEFVSDVSHPKSKNFGKHWTPQQVMSTFAPSKQAVDETVSWLMSMGIPGKNIAPSAGRNWLKVTTTVAQAEKLLKTSYSTYKDDEGSVLLACEEYAVPANVQPYIDFVTPTIQFDSKLATPETRKVSKREALAPNRKAVTILSDPDSLDNCSNFITPACLRAIYGLPETGEAVEGNSYGILEIAPQSYNQGDLDTFFTVYASNVPNGTAPIVDSIDGGFFSNATDSGTRGESNLDLCYAMGLVYPQNVTLFQTGDGVIWQPATYNNFLDAIDGSYCSFEGGDDPLWDTIYPHTGLANGYEGEPMCGTYNKTNVISVSYGAVENNHPESYQRRQCDEYMKLALMGVSIMYASGDSSVAGNTGECLDPNDGTPRPRGYPGRFDPFFPASCPWVTTVGGSVLPPNGSVTDRQIVPTDFVPGGGFSNYFALPDWQKSTMENYYAKHDPGYNSSVYNNTQQARGYPDVAVSAVNFITGLADGFQAFSGTSAAAPTFGAMITLINGERIKAGKGPIGFLNPIMYEHPEMFNDIIEGNIPGCGTDGFFAVEGWDPASGLGTPIYPKMRDIMVNLP